MSNQAKKERKKEMQRKAPQKSGHTLTDGPTTFHIRKVCAISKCGRWCAARLQPFHSLSFLSSTCTLLCFACSRAARKWLLLGSWTTRTLTSVCLTRQTQSRRFACSPVLLVPRLLSCPHLTPSSRFILCFCRCLLTH